MTPQGELMLRAIAARGGSVYGLAKAMGLKSHRQRSALAQGVQVIHDPARIERAAEYLGIDADALYLAAGDVPHDVLCAILRHPDPLLKIIRLAVHKIEE